MEVREIWKKLTRRENFCPTINSFLEGTEIVYMVRESKKPTQQKHYVASFVKVFFAPNNVMAHENTCFLTN